MAKYSIRDLEKLSGIKAHTIRIWEQRYNIIEPKRTATNIRFYTDDDLQYILNVAFLNRNGQRISKISKMSRVEISIKVTSISQESLENNNQQQALTIAMIELSEEKFEQTINQSIGKEGFIKTVSGLIVPFLEKLSLLWLTGSIGNLHEQFINNLIRQKIAVYTNSLPIPDPDVASQKPRVLLFEPTGDDQEVMLSIINFLFRSKGCKTMYLGRGISLKDITLAESIFEPNCFLTILSDSSPKNNPQDFLNKLCKQFPEIQVLVTSKSGIKSHLLPENVAVLEDFSEFLEFLEEID